MKQNKSPPSLASPFFILDHDGKPVPVADVAAWAEWVSKTGTRHLAFDELSSGITVSTVFLGVDHNHSGRGPPVLWETMIFGGPDNQYQERYTSQEDALRGHAAALARAKAGLSKAKR